MPTSGHAELAEVILNSVPAHDLVATGGNAGEAQPTGHGLQSQVDGDTATLKRVRLYPDHIILEPENPTYRPMVFWEEDMNKVHIIGKATHFISAVR